MQSGFAKWLKNHASLRKLRSFRRVRSLTVAVRLLVVRSLAVAALKAFELA